MDNTDMPSRRKVLSAGATAAAFSIFKPSVVRGYQANSQVSVGLIGTGNRGSYDAGIANADPRARVTALCDLFDDRIEMATSSIKAVHPVVYKDFEKLLASPDIDAVFIATPPFEHPRMFEAAVEARKHIYCEKPAGVDLEGVKRVMAAGRKADPKKNVAFGYQQRYGPVYLEAFRRLKDGAIGDLTNARAFWIDKDPFKRKPYADAKTEKLRNWFAYKELSGDIIVEQDCHNLDVLHWFLDACPTRAAGMGGRKVRTSMDILDHLTLSYEFPNQIHVNFEANQISPAGFKRVGEEFTGTTGLLETSRQRMVHHQGPKQSETIESKRDITNDAVEAFLTNILNGTPENVAERSAVSTLFAILGRTAIYENREVSWKGEFGEIGS